MSPHNTERIDKFFSTIDPWINAYSHIGLSYFAVRKEGVIHLLQARLFLNTASSVIPHEYIETTSVLAGHLSFSELGMELRDFVDCLVENGEFETQHGVFNFPPEMDREYSAYFDPFHQEGIASGNRLPVLMISGDKKHQYIEQPNLDWELKAATKPFDSIDEVLGYFSLGGGNRDSVSIEIIASHVAEINFKAAISGTDAYPSVFLAKSVDTRKCQIGYRVFLHSKVVERGSIQGGDLNWSEQERSRQGEAKISIPQGAVLHCVASYDGYAQHQGWIYDPTLSQNARRVTLEVFDERLEILRDYLFEEQKPRKNARDFELGVAWLIWMLGFNGGAVHTSDASDVIATSPTGNILIVECTIGALKSDKVAKLVERSQNVRKRLSASGNNNLKVVAVLVTSKSRDEVQANIGDLNGKGIAVVTKENLESALTQTIVLPDTEAIYARLWQEAQPKPSHQLGGLISPVPPAL